MSPRQRSVWVPIFLQLVVKYLTLQQSMSKICWIFALSVSSSVSVSVFDSESTVHQSNIIFSAPPKSASFSNNWCIKEAYQPCWASRNSRALDFCCSRSFFTRDITWWTLLAVENWNLEFTWVFFDRYPYCQASVSSFISPYSPGAPSRTRRTLSRRACLARLADNDQSVSSGGEFLSLWTAFWATIEHLLSVKWGITHSYKLFVCYWPLAAANRSQSMTCTCF